MKKPISEVDLAAIVVAWLNTNGWDVYQEVHLEGSTIDIVAKKEDKTWCIETKTTLNLELLYQVDKSYRNGYSDYISIAVPKSKSSNGRCFAKRLLKERGIGVLTVNYDNFTKPYIITEVVAREQTLKTKSCEMLCEVLVPEAKTFALAGNNQGMFYSPYKRTIGNIKEFLLKNPGSNMEQIVNGISHHYKNKSSAKGALKLALVNFEYAWCRIESIGSDILYYVYPDEGNI